MKNDRFTVQKLLLELGFAHTDAETYWALLNLPTVSIRKVSQQSGINRGTTYEAIRRLIAVGLVGVRHKGQREYFTAESPEKIYDLIRDRRKDLWETQQRAQELIPDLLAKKARPVGRPVVRYYEDDEGIVAILKDVLQTCGQLEQPQYYAYSSRPLRQYLYRSFPEFTERRIREGIAVKVIAVGEGGDPADVSERKWLGEPNDDSTSSYVLIYDNKVANISISNDNTPYGVVVEDAGVAAMQRLLFERLWDII
ncbi:MAG TPA: helix-turn-helix domain-containing protein [Candidatus Saccharimonadales bacterium]|nr:helix-turn-helix domain-containing protein [Candidatus Saccharimonadales bacterium]